MLSSLDNFANGRDVGTVSKGIFKAIMKEKKSAGEARTVPEKIVLDQIDLMIAERTIRAQSTKSTLTAQATAGASSMRTEVRDAPAPPVTRSIAASQTAVDAKPEPIEPSKEDPNDNNPHKASIVIRDASVSDQVWDQLQKDAQKAQDEKRECQRLAEKEEELRQWLKKCADAKLQHELEEIERKRIELEEKLRLEEEQLAKLTVMGLCPMGYHWIKQTGGYRCAGGSHGVSDSQMQKMCT